MDMEELNVAMSSIPGVVGTPGVVAFSRVLEDHRVLSKALAIKPDDVVISITSAGDNILNLLLDQPQKIIAVDISPAQSACLELKLAAIKHLDYDGYIDVLGETSVSGDRKLALYDQIKDHLPTYAKEFWDSNKEGIKLGACLYGALSKAHFQSMTYNLSKVLDEKIMDDFFSAETLEKQKEIFRKFPCDKLKEFEIIFWGEVRPKKAYDGTNLENVDTLADKFLSEMWKRFCHICEEVPVKDNFYLSWYLRGLRGWNPKIKPEISPPYLREDRFQQLKGLVDRVEVQTSSVEEYLAQSTCPLITKANLSNIFEFTSKEKFNASMEKLASKMAPNSKAIYWVLFNPQTIASSSGTERWKRNDELSDSLHREDRVYIYMSLHVLDLQSHD